MNCLKCRPSCPCESCINKAKMELESHSDGPLTDFVFISRAMRMAARNKYSPEILANALQEVLTEYGMMKAESPLLETGS